jgi:hypothetical protein
VQKTRAKNSHAWAPLTLIHTPHGYTTRVFVHFPNLKGLSHEMDGHAWSILDLQRGRRQFLNFLCAPMIVQRKKCIFRG